MQPINSFEKVELPDDLFFVRKPERSQGRLVIPSDIAKLIGCSIGDAITLTARNPETDVSVTFTQTFIMGDNKITMPKAARDAIGLPHMDTKLGITGGWEYANVEFHIKALYRAPKSHPEPNEDF